VGRGKLFRLSLVGVEYFEGVGHFRICCKSGSVFLLVVSLVSQWVYAMDYDVTLTVLLYPVYHGPINTTYGEVCKLDSQTPHHTISS